jgi:hypothetical protein
MTKDQLKEMVRQELQAVLAEKKKVKDEDKKEKLDENEVTLEESPIVDILGILAGVGGIGLTGAAIAKAQDMLKAKNPKLYNDLASIKTSIAKADPSKNLEENEEEVNEMIDPSTVADVLGVLAGMGGIAASAVALDKWQERIKMKNPELYKKMQDLSTTIKRAKGIQD